MKKYRVRIKVSKISLFKRPKIKVTRYVDSGLIFTRMDESENEERFFYLFI